jgi:hypothetical protein
VALLTGLGLVWSQIWLTRRTNRLVSPGLLMASIAGLATLIWLVSALALAGAHLSYARDRGSAPVEALARADIAALRAHADESLTLIDRRGDDSYEQDFRTVERQLGPGNGTLLGVAAATAQGSPGGSAAASALHSAPTWFAVHKQVRSLDDSGKYGTAVTLAIGSGPVSSGVLFGHLDTDLTSAIGADQTAFRTGAQAAQGDLAGLEAGVIVLTVVMAGGCVFALSRRLAEYR